MCSWCCFWGFFRCLWSFGPKWEHHYQMGHHNLDRRWLCGMYICTHYHQHILNLDCVICSTVQATVTMYNFQQYRHIQAPGWTLGWSWAKREVIWGMNGGQTTEQGDCSKFKGTIPHCCKKTPSVVDLLPGTPYNQQVANCCRGGVINSWAQDPATAVSSFQLTVGQAGTTNKTVRVPKNFTLKAPGPGYTCGPGKIVKPSRFVGTDKRRVTQAMSKLILFLK